MQIAKRIFQCVAVAAAATAFAAAPSQAQYYSGKTITLLIGYSPSSGVTGGARTLAPYWEKHIPGKPTIIIKNMPGAGSLKAQNFYYEKAKRDGMLIYFGPIAVVGKVIGNPGLRSKYEEMRYLGGFGRTMIVLTRKPAIPEVKKPADIAMAKKKIVIAGTRPTSNISTIHRISFELLGVPHRYVPGYRGAEKAMTAVLRGEVDSYSATDSFYRANAEATAVKTGKVLPLYYYPTFDINGKPEKNKYFPELMSFVDVYKQVHGKEPSGPKWEAMKWIMNFVGKMVLSAYALPGVPDQAVADLRKGFYAAMGDAAFQKEYFKRFSVGVTPMSIEQGTQYLQTFEKANPEMVKFLKGYHKKKK